ncbi:3-hydroxyacyl-CoA dehydrogenase NAD-binding domain-containing protein [Falsigemmobacter faecalis]|uniref:3-hydroxyacyl-CoA dehydrogenase n=1 Tax=Falsigemmobacter faecalis TaxID=2488730 RepID=A0A3P3DQW0_9RHOB|nr:3-hydroxyacyl-CoA dehydrogenase NAD-binding domain-containing protein [Falsigemmobacter faecalis]RRH76609.1 3-hydroxyacyl-CoA dehydrogenase [Falsigemmobacter faecalis]
MTVSVIKNGAIARVIIDNPPVNAISAAVRQGLLDAVRAVEADDAVRAVVLSCAGRTFVAGADVTEFDKPPVEPHLPDVLDALEACAKPFAAQIHGTALGGGLEIALACRWRLAVPGSQMGLPEVNLGIIPGSGGTVRTPRLVGTEAAADLITSGKPVKADKALALGLIDAILPAEAADQAAEDFVTAALGAALPEITSTRATGQKDEAFWTETAARVKKAAKGNTGPVEALASLKNATEVSFAEAMAFERETFLRLRKTDQAAALRHIFFAERAAPRPSELKGVTPRPFTRIGVIGGGTMGAGIAVALRNAGIPVQMIERDAEAAVRGQANVEKILKGDLAKGRISEAKYADLIGGFNSAADYAAVADCDLVIEAVFEDFDVKRAVFAELTRVCAPDAILATNTSYLNPDEIVADLPGPERFIGLHFFSPANIMKLLEIVPTSGSAPDVIAAGFALAAKAGKMPVRAGICDGFIGNRILKLTRTTAERLVVAGAEPSQVDNALQKFGFALGPFRTQDLSGLDIGAFQRKAARGRGESPWAPVADRVFEAGRLGRKTNGGWYDYDTAGKEAPGTPAAVAEAIAAARADAGVTAPATFSDAEIVEAIMFPMINESAKIVAEGIAFRDSDVDLVKVAGYGFPRYRGGPVQYGRAIGFAKVAEGLEALAAKGLAEGPSEALKAWAAKA